MTKFPKHAGVYWASFDDGHEVIEVALVHVGPYPYSTSLDDGAFVRFIAEPTRFFEMENVAQDFVQPVANYTSIVGSQATAKEAQVHVTWLTEVKAPKTAPKPGDEVGVRR